MKSMVRHCQRLPREAVAAPYRNVQAQVRWGLEQCGPVEGVPAHVKGSGVRWPFLRSFHPKPFSDSIRTFLLLDKFLFIFYVKQQHSSDNCIH